MVKKATWVLLSIVLVILTLIGYHYPKLTIVSGYVAKNMSSSVFVADRSPVYTAAHDHNFPLINLANTVVDTNSRGVSASVFGLMPRKAIFRKGLGSILIHDAYDLNATYQVPNREKVCNPLPYPYGNLPQKDTIFPEINYDMLREVIHAAFDLEGKTIKNTRALLVLYKDHIIAEKYTNGITKDARVLGWSMTKSIWSTLFGILVKQGKLALSDPAPVPQWQYDSRKQITIHHLLQMSSGLEWEESYTSLSDASRMLFLETDMTQSQVYKELIHKPGTFWNYSSGTSNLLSGILRRQFKTYQEYLDFPYNACIDKIGMHSMILETDMSGNYVGSSYAWATPRDWAKLGLLYLHKGHWNGEQLIDTSWVRYVTTPVPSSEKRYGGHFWLNAGGFMPDVPRDAFHANGFQGQRIFIIPSKHLIIVRFGLTERGKIDFNTLVTAIIQTITQDECL